MNPGSSCRRRSRWTELIPRHDSGCREVGYRVGIEPFTSLRRTVQRVNPLILDGALAILIFALIEAQGQPERQRAAPLSVALVALETLPLTFRRRAPTVVVLVVGLASVGHLVAGFHNGFFDTFAAVIALYSVAAHSRRQTSLAFLTLLPIALAVAIAVDWHNTGVVNLIDIPYNLVFFLTGWVLGDGQRTRRAYVAQLEERERMLARERVDRVRATLAEERTRIARELHDIVAHSVSVMVLQANAGERIVGTRPEQAAQNLAAIQATGRQALAELRRLLGVLRGDESVDGERAPQPRISDVQDLALQAQQAGLETTVTSEGDATRLPEAIQLSAYRIIQEALTNILRHAGASHATILIRCTSSTLEVEVQDDGKRASQPAESAGHGLVGMRERVQLFGGDLRTGPQPGGGFRVLARLPLESRPA